MTPRFTDSWHCLSESHCVACRDRDGGRIFRESLSRVFTLPGGEVDFECPRGKQWGWSQPPGERVENQAPEEGATKGQLGWGPCDECDHQHWPSGGARGCALIDGGKPCALGARLRAGGPWPDECPRKTDRSANG